MQYLGLCTPSSLYSQVVAVAFSSGADEVRLVDTPRGAQLEVALPSAAAVDAFKLVMTSLYPDFTNYVVSEV